MADESGKSQSMKQNEEEYLIGQYVCYVDKASPTHHRRRAWDIKSKETKLTASRLTLYVQMALSSMEGKVRNVLLPLNEG